MIIVAAPAAAPGRTSARRQRGGSPWAWARRWNSASPARLVGAERIAQVPGEVVAQHGRGSRWRAPLRRRSAAARLPIAKLSASSSARPGRSPSVVAAQTAKTNGRRSAPARRRRDRGHAPGHGRPRAPGRRSGAASCAASIVDRRRGRGRIEPAGGEQQAQERDRVRLLTSTATERISASGRRETSSTPAPRPRRRFVSPSRRTPGIRASSIVGTRPTSSVPAASRSATTAGGRSSASTPSPPSPCRSPRASGHEFR